MTPPVRPCPRDPNPLSKRQAFRTAVHRSRYLRQPTAAYPCDRGHWHVTAIPSKRRDPSRGLPTA